MSMPVRSLLVCYLFQQMADASQRKLEALRFLYPLSVPVALIRSTRGLCVPISYSRSFARLDPACRRENRM